MRLAVSSGNPVWFAFRTVAESDFFHDAVNRPFTGNINALRLSQNKCLIHTAPPIGIVVFIFRYNFPHDIR